MKKTWGVIAVAILTTGILAGRGGKATETTATAPEMATTIAASAGVTTATESKADLIPIVIGVSPAPHAEVLKAAKGILAEQGYDLRTKEYTGHMQPSPALDTKDSDANYFQRYPYLEQSNQKGSTKISSAAVIHYESFGIYVGKTASLGTLADGTKIAVPNDATDEAKALLLLEAQGLTKLKKGVGLDATKSDMIENVKKLGIFETETAQIPCSLQDVDIAIIDGDYAIGAGLKVSGALAIEDAASIAATTYGGIMAVQEGHEKDSATLTLVDALTSDTVKKFTEDKYAGAIVPLF